MRRVIGLAVCVLGILLAAGKAPACAAAPKLVERYRNLFPVLEKLGGLVWENGVPYTDVPVLAYDPAAQEEFLINYPAPVPPGYAATPYGVNGRTVYRKEGVLTVGYAGGQCCRAIGGRPVVVMGYGPEVPAVSVLRTLLHEGFHYYQYSPLFSSGADEALDNGKSALFSGIPRDLEYDKLLVAEAKLLYALTGEKNSPQSIGAELLSDLAAVDLLRKKMLPPEAVFGEESQLLLEGTAVYVELKGLLALLESGQELYGTGISTETVKTEYESYRRHYGADMLANQINLTTLANGELVYRYAAGFARVLEKTGTSWQKGLFPLVAGGASSKETMERQLRETVAARGFSAKIAERGDFSGDTARGVWEKLRTEMFSPEEIAGMEEKLKIERGMDSFPFGAGWSYKIEAGQAVYPYFDFMRGKMYTGKKGTAAYLSGLAKLETADKRLSVGGIGIPVVSNMFHGSVRFKDAGKDPEAAVLVCEDKAGDVCGRLTLALPGLKFVAVNALFSRDSAARETTIKLR